MPARNLLIIILAAALSWACYQKTQRSRYAGEVASAMHIIRENYVEEVDSRELYENAMDGMVSGLDQHSGYISKKDFAEFQEGLVQEFGGVGMQVEGPPESEKVTVISPLPDTPAHLGVFVPGDVILSIDGKSIKGIKSMKSEALPKMRGKPGSTVQLSVLHPGENKPSDITLTRAIIPIESVRGVTRKVGGGWDFRLPRDKRIAYIELSTFGEHSVDELSRVLTSEELNPEGLIIDLRDNAGGLLTAAVEICNLFIREGVIVTTRGRGGDLKKKYTAQAKTLLNQKIPLVVLINGYSASASEIMAGCLQDHQRATIIGVRSYGKGSVQNIIKLEDGESALRLTTASYWRPSERNIHRTRKSKVEDEWGVKPDKGMEIPLDEEQAKARAVAARKRYTAQLRYSVGDVSAKEDASAPIDTADPQLQRAIEYLQELTGGAPNADTKNAANEQEKASPAHDEPPAP